MPAENYLLVQEAARVLKVSPNTIRLWAENGKITEYRHPVNNYRLFNRDEVFSLRTRILNPKPLRKRKRTRAK